jgi:glycosyltransferase involved in cell wall biosynthesis
MYRDRVVAAVVPAWNEERHVDAVIKTMPEFVDHIIVVDDASSDRTAEIATACNDPRLTLIRHERNAGVGGSIISGYLKALELEAQLLTVMAGDGQMDPDYLSSLLTPLVEKRADFTKGNRFYSMDSLIGMPKHRIFGNVLLSFLTKLASGYWHMVDPQNGYVAITSDMLGRINLDRIARGYQFENDMLISLNIVGARLQDVPIPSRYGDQTSGIRLRRVVPAILRLLLKGFWRRVFYKYVLWSFSPAALFLFSGLLLCLWGVGFGVWVLIQTLGAPVATTGTVILSVVPLLLGVQFLIAFLVLDIQESSRPRD